MITPRHISSLKRSATSFLCLLLTVFVAGTPLHAQTTPPPAPAYAIIPVGTTGQATLIYNQTFTGGPFSYPGAYYCTIHNLAGNSYSYCTLNDTNGSVTLGDYASPEDVVIEVKYDYSQVVNNVQTYTCKRFRFIATFVNLAINNSGIQRTGTVNAGNVMVGRQMEAFASVYPTAAAAAYEWTIGGDKIKNYTQRAYNPNANPPLIPPAEGKVTLFDDAVLKTSNFTFYFIKGDFNGTVVNVQIDITVGGKTITRTGTVKVFSPNLGTTTKTNPDGTTSQITGFTAKWTSLIPRVRKDDQFLRLGSLTGTPERAGITWQSAVAAPAPGAGQIAYTQTINEFREWTTADTTPIPQQYSSKGSYVLDDPEGIQYRGAATIGSNSTALLERDDSPGNSLSAGYIETRANDSFITYLMYKPDGANSIWVTLAKLAWSWSGRATNTAPFQEAGNWTIQPQSTPSDGAAPPTSEISSEQPKWEDSFKAIESRGLQAGP